jgi:hypothetical protein
VVERDGEIARDVLTCTEAAAVAHILQWLRPQRGQDRVVQQQLERHTSPRGDQAPERMGPLRRPCRTLFP